MDNFIRIPFAEFGDKTAVPDDLQVDGTVSFTEGYGADYALELGVDPSAKFIERDKFNYLMGTLSAAVQALQVFGGASAFITATDNGGTAYPYAAGARVLLSGVIYESLINGNTDTPPGANWAVVDPLAQVPVGSLIATAAASADPGYIIAQGQAVSRTTYARLFARIGTTYGAGDGVSTFNLPDTRGVALRGLDASRGLDPGRVLGTYQADAFASHRHAFPVFADTSVLTNFDNYTLDTAQVGGAGLDSGGLSNNGMAMPTGAGAAQGSTETRMKNIAVNWQIKY